MLMLIHPHPFTFGISDVEASLQPTPLQLVPYRHVFETWWLRWPLKTIHIGRPVMSQFRIQTLLTFSLFFFQLPFLPLTSPFPLIFSLSQPPSLCPSCHHFLSGLDFTTRRTFLRKSLGLSPRALPLPYLYQFHFLTKKVEILIASIHKSSFMLQKDHTGKSV